VQHGFWKGENEMQSLDGKIYPVLQTIVLMKDANGQPQFTSSTAIDISERKRLELSLKSSDQKLKQAEMIGKFGYFEFDLTNQIFHFSEGACKIYGLNSSQVPDAVVQGMRLPEYNNSVNESIKTLKNNGDQLDIEFKIKRLQDDQIAGIHVVSRYDDSKHVIFGSMQDITERMNVAEALKRSEEKFKHLINEINLGVFVYGANAEINLFNSKAIELFGISEEQILSKKIFNKAWDVIHEDGSNFPAETYPGILAFVHKKIIKDVVMGVCHQIKKERVWILVTAIPEFEHNDVISQVVVTFYDITEKRKKDEKIKKLNDELKELAIRLQKLREYERNKLAGEVHDKLGQKLVGIKFQIDFLRSQLNEERPEFTKKADSIAEEIALMVKDFSVIYADVNPSFIDDLPLYDTIDGLIHSYRKYDKIKFKFSSNIQNERLSHQIKWVLYKTVNGCLDNIVLHSQANMVSVKLFKKNGILSLIVQDDGCGFDTSKIDFKTQIGLIEMRESVQSIGGVIDFESAPGKGTKVKVGIPEIV
jgi:PAS domain S-box-containing protein